jgi:hypothetical protein
MARKHAPADISVTPGSGNVFADLGFEEPEEELAKAQLASHLRQHSPPLLPLVHELPPEPPLDAEVAVGDIVIER